MNIVKHIRRDGTVLWAVPLSCEWHRENCPAYLSPEGASWWYFRSLVCRDDGVAILFPLPSGPHRAISRVEVMRRLFSQMVSRTRSRSSADCSAGSLMAAYLPGLRAARGNRENGADRTRIWSVLFRRDCAYLPYWMSAGAWISQAPVMSISYHWNLLAATVSAILVHFLSIPKPISLDTELEQVYGSWTVATVEPQD